MCLSARVKREGVNSLSVTRFIRAVLFDVSICNLKGNYERS